MRWRGREAAEDLNEGLILAEVARQCGWLVIGRQVEGPSGTAVRVNTDDSCGAQTSSAHVALEFWLRKGDPEAPIIRDCAVGNGDSDADRVAMAVTLWKSITLPVALELLAQDGCFADHFPPSDPKGLPGWHCIHGPWLGWGTSESQPEALQRWALDHPVLPLLANGLTPALDRTNPSGSGCCSGRIARLTLPK